MCRAVTRSTQCAEIVQVIHGPAAIQRLDVMRFEWAAPTRNLRSDKRSGRIPFAVCAPIAPQGPHDADSYHGPTSRLTGPSCASLAFGHGQES